MVLDWFSRRVLAERPSITLDAEFCLDAAQLHCHCGARHGKPVIFDTDQGSQCTRSLQDQVIEISTDGRRAWQDNVFVERLWRPVKYEEFHLRVCDSVSNAGAALGGYLAFFNGRQRHSSLRGRMPERAYLDHLPHSIAA